MTKSELISKMAEKTGTTKKIAGELLNAFTETVTEALSENDRVAITGFGTFRTRWRAARTTVNPQTGQPMEVEARYTPCFKAGKLLKDAVKSE